MQGGGKLCVNDMCWGYPLSTVEAQKASIAMYTTKAQGQLTM
jgi:hypothetical protein